jgi:surface protein
MGCNHAVNEIKLEVKFHNYINNNHISNTKFSFNNIKSGYILKQICKNIERKKLIEILRYNKILQNKLNINIDEYKEFSNIEIEIIPIKRKYGNFININNEKDFSYYHIYFDDDKEEIKRTYIKEEEYVSKIKVIINYEINSFHQLFKNCECIKSINFKTFYRKNIENTSEMFYKCIELKELNISNFNSENVTNMENMFLKCQSLEKLDLSSFNTKKVTNMTYMFYGCKSLKEINISSFNTNNVTNMSYMFLGCNSLKELNLYSFNTQNVTNMSYMFLGCKSLYKLDLSNFSLNKNYNNMSHMVSLCSSLKKLILPKAFINKAVDTKYIFSGCESLKELTPSDLDDNVKNDEFNNKCKNIRTNSDDTFFQLNIILENEFYNYI